MSTILGPSTSGKTKLARNPLHPRLNNRVACKVKITQGGELPRADWKLNSSPTVDLKTTLVLKQSTQAWLWDNQSIPKITSNLDILNTIIYAGKVLSWIFIGQPIKMELQTICSPEGVAIEIIGSSGSNVFSVKGAKCVEMKELVAS